MMLSDELIKFIALQDAIEPFDEDNLQPSSYDLTLSGKFVRQNGGLVIPQKSSTFDSVEEFDSDTFDLEPGDFVLGSTIETVHIPPDLAARFEGKSSLGRIGLCTHITAGFIDPGFMGTITVELSNLGNSTIRLWKGMKIGQICFFQLFSRPLRVYGEDSLGSHYQNQDGPTVSYFTDQSSNECIEMNSQNAKNRI